MKNNFPKNSFRRFFHFALLSAGLFFCFSCASLGRALENAACPCAVYDSQTAEHGVLGIEFTFVNLSGKDIQSVKFFAGLGCSRESEFYESDFPADSGFFEKEFIFSCSSESGGAERVFIPFGEFDSEDYFVEKLSVLEIVFQDGSVWENCGKAEIF